MRRERTHDFPTPESPMRTTCVQQGQSIHFTVTGSETWFAHLEEIVKVGSFGHVEFARCYRARKGMFVYRRYGSLKNRTKCLRAIWIRISALLWMGGDVGEVEDESGHEFKAVGSRFVWSCFVAIVAPESLDQNSTYAPTALKLFSQQK